MDTLTLQNGPHTTTAIKVAITAPSTQVANTTVDAYKNGVLLMNLGTGRTSRVIIQTSSVSGPDLVLGIDPATPFLIAPSDGDTLLLV